MDNVAVIKSRVDMAELVSRYGVEANGRGQGRCPFHDDKHPSASVKNGRFHCYVCNLHLDVFDFVQQAESCDFKAAMARLNALFGLGLDLDKPPPKEELDRINRERRAREKERDAFREAYEARQAVFVRSRELLDETRRAGRYDLAGAITGHMERQEEWFAENPWR